MEVPILQLRLIEAKNLAQGDIASKSPTGSETYSFHSQTILPWDFRAGRIFREQASQSCLLLSTRLRPRGTDLGWKTLAFVCH